MKRIVCTFCFSLIFMTIQAQFTYDLQGHRGARGLMPENTIPAMIKALDLGVTTLELDLAVTKDGEIIVSHEPWMNGMICFDPEGNEIAKENKDHNIYQLTYSEIAQYDCGSKAHDGFSKQVNFRTSKPRLIDLIDEVEQYVADLDLIKPKYNIEIKSFQEGDDLYHPNPKDFSDKVYQVINSHLDWDRVNIQSFDFRVLQYYHQTYPEVNLAMLVDNAAKANVQLETLGFQPAIYSPYFVALTASIVSELQKKGMKVIPWTVNSEDQMANLLEMGVDGIITDYPNLAPKR